MSDLPENWVSAQLGEVCKVVRGITFPASARQEKSTPKNVCCLRTTNVQKEVDWDDVYFVSAEYVKRADQFVKIGDILMSMANSYELVGKVSVVRELPYSTSFGAFISAVRPMPDIEAQYLFHVLRTAKVQSELRKGSSQTVNIANISVSRLSEIEIPLAPLNEQKRIAEKLDRVLARVDSCESHLERVPEILKRFRQSVLAAATSGRLTEDWREEKGVNGEWETVQLSQVATSRLGKMLDVAKNRGELKPYLRNINVRWLAFDLSDIQEFRISDEEAETLGVRKGDVLVCEGGEPGRCAVWHGEDDIYLFQKALHRVRVSEKLLPEWLCYSLKSSADSGQLADYFTGTTIKHFTGVALSRFEFDLPSIEEQAEIVRRVEKLFAYTERLNARYRSADERVERLTPSLLAKAFRGELVEQDPNDEPASILQERIRKAREYTHELSTKVKAKVGGKNAKKSK